MPAKFDNLTTLSVTIQDKIAHLELCRPEQLNSMIPAFWNELPTVINAIDGDSMARVIVISAQGKHFSAGMDLSVFANMQSSFTGEPGRRAERLRRMVLELQQSFNALEECRIPVLVAVHGGVIGGALDMLCACDSRYATESAFFSIKETQLGMTADVGTLQRLPHLMPHGLVKELAFTGRTMSATEALSFGFINRIFSDYEQMIEGVMQIASMIAANSPLAVTGCKQMLNYARDHSVKDSLEYMATWQSGMFQMPDVMAAMHADKAKTVAEFEELHGKHAQMK